MLRLNLLVTIAASLLLTTPLGLRAQTDPPATNAPLLETYWKLEQADEQEVLRHPRAAEPYLVFRSDGKLIGSDGCNRLFGGFRIDSERMTFGPIGGTRMACPMLKGSDAAFQKLFQSVTGWRIEGDRLELLSADKPVARFKSIVLRP